MSADLLAAFGQAPVPDSKSIQKPSQYRKPPFLTVDGNFDFFGSSESVQHKERSNPNPAAVSQFAAPEASRQSPGHQEFDLPLNPGSDLFFDAALDAPASDEDDWGEFEGPDANTQHAQSTSLWRSTITMSPSPEPRQDSTQVSTTIDLLDSLSMQDSRLVVKHPSTIAKKNPNLGHSNNQHQATWEDDSFGDWGDFTDAPASQPTPKVSEKRTQPPRTSPTKPPVKSTNAPASTWDDDAFDDWGDFSDGPIVKALPKSKPASPPTAPSPAPSSSVSGTTAPTATIRPTNIPPPSILLELFLDVFENLRKEATLAKSQLRSSASPSSQAVSTTALNVHLVLQTAARIIAGRSLRWKRDTILSQSMRIGPARSGKAGGMKLNSVNKQENIKEEQDAVDVLTTWRERAVVFNAILQAAGQRPIPVVQDPSAFKVITARADQGALKASHPCALCSLKRDERVLRVDEQSVQDSFGEWWTEHWGHTACRQFWETNRNLLGQR
ncbi:serine/threonine-protein kinase ppk6 [Penicillium digitatum]|uniref:Serine/threonine-protein kinase ppk6 n=3 Tax=Penicillium digitatum TaxID=36651 RepID=K9G8R2_PEND2|nr:hypothetical protein PDIP_70130 [Penicillium digitatum Pd1]EKV08050.1 hypothetical protein PDIP_70130 [Penicillium digitatum Pd1]EKV09646.1 hypothetical protein PDIG_60700 [Penicillium digitatum PHI26]KAG0158940.1 hypothetical protein PDIDSM_6460 [Penicillium digitatum]QQK41563.1 serine/threonine-protein kinase ppk6 [Penicillium digitatum]